MNEQAKPYAAEMPDWQRQIAEAHAKGTCVVCQCIAKPRIYSAAGQEEYDESATCEVCFERMFGDHGDTSMEDPLEADDDDELPF